jgi:hypothetical protein
VVHDPAEQTPTHRHSSRLRLLDNSVFDIRYSLSRRATIQPFVVPFCCPQRCPCIRPRPLSRFFAPPGWVCTTSPLCERRDCLLTPPLPAKPPAHRHRDDSATVPSSSPPSSVSLPAGCAQRVLLHVRPVPFPCLTPRASQFSFHVRRVSTVYCADVLSSLPKTCWCHITSSHRSWTRRLLFPRCKHGFPLGARIPSCWSRPCAHACNGRSSCSW